MQYLVILVGLQVTFHLLLLKWWQRDMKKDTHLNQIKSGPQTSVILYIILPMAWKTHNYADCTNINIYTKIKIYAIPFLLSENVSVHIISYFLAFTLNTKNASNPKMIAHHFQWQEDVGEHFQPLILLLRWCVHHLGNHQQQGGLEQTFRCFECYPIHPVVLWWSLKTWPL